jgi:Domain of unknown function (DUF4331)
MVPFGKFWLICETEPSDTFVSYTDIAALLRFSRKEIDMKRLLKQLFAAVMLGASAIAAQASSHREALAILNEPCADNTDTYAWVKPGTHDKLYLIMDFNPLHEPGQGNQGLRACNGYLYQFHIGIGASLRDRVVYRVEFKNKITPEAPHPDREIRQQQPWRRLSQQRHRHRSGQRSPGASQ